MPEKGWYSLTVRMETAKRVRELSKARDLTVDELINELMKPTSGGGIIFIPTNQRVFWAVKLFSELMP